MKFECVNKEQYESDPHHADYRKIEAKTRNGAKFLYSKLTNTPYDQVLCKTEKGHAQWTPF